LYLKKLHLLSNSCWLFLLIVIANFVITLFKLTSPANYLFWEIHVKLTFALNTYSGAIFTAENMLNTLALSQTTDVNEITRRNFLDSQVLAILNSTLLDNLLMHIQPNTKALSAHLWTLIEISSPVLVFVNYQRIVMFQISSD